MGSKQRRFGSGRLSLAFALVLLGSGVNATTGQAATSEAAGVVLSDAAGSASWTGAFRDVATASDAGLYAQPGACELLACRESTVEVALPAGVWDAQPGGVQISIDWTPNLHDDLDLYVYGSDGSLAARSAGMNSTSESVRVPQATNGRYRVVVVPQAVFGAVEYQGFVKVERDTPTEPARPLLPNLVMLPLREPTMKTSAYLTDHEVEQAHGPSCYPEEMAEKGARRCLRFDQVIANVGDGPFELRYRMEGIATDQQLRQRILSSNGSFREVAVDTYEFHPTHAHFHYKNFAQAFLHRIRPDGSLELVRKGQKNGFCMIDVENTRFGLDEHGVPFRGEAPRDYHLPRCNMPTERDEHGTYMVNGISVGWADVYNWYFADQYIEISGVPDGDYVIETVANPARTVHETTVDDNAALATIRLWGDTVTLLGAGVVRTPE
jgi:hypothetical protein